MQQCDINILPNSPANITMDFEDATSSGLTNPCAAVNPLNIWYQFSTTSSGNVLMQHRTTGGNNGTTYFAFTKAIVVI